MAVLRHGGMKKIIAGAYAPSTLGSFLRSFTFGHVRQLDEVASRLKARKSPLFSTPTGENFIFVDVDDTIVEVHSYAKEGSR